MVGNNGCEEDEGKKEESLICWDLFHSKRLELKEHLSPQMKPPSCESECEVFKWLGVFTKYCGEKSKGVGGDAGSSNLSGAFKLFSTPDGS